MKSNFVTKLIAGAAIASIYLATPSVGLAQVEYKLRFSDLGPDAATPRPMAEKWWAEEIKKRTVNGRAKLDQRAAQNVATLKVA